MTDESSLPPSASLPPTAWIALYDRFRAGEIPLPLQGWGTVAVRGRDARQVLHNLCTNQVRELQPGQGCEAFFPNVKGKTIGHGYLLVREDEVLVLVPPGAVAALAAHVDRYIIREDAAPVDVSADYVWWATLDAAVAGKWLSATAPAESLARPWDHAALPRGILVRSALPYAGSCFLALNPDVAGAGLPSPDAAEARAALEAVRLEVQWPWWGVEISEANLPQEIGRDAEAISFRKGCYLGQETIARLDALGHVNQQLRWLRLEGAADVPAVGTPLVAAEGSVEAGRVASACWSPRYAGPVAAALVRTAYAAPGTRLQCGAASAEVLPGKA